MAHLWTPSYLQGHTVLIENEHTKLRGKKKKVENVKHILDGKCSSAEGGMLTLESPSLSGLLLKHGGQVGDSQCLHSVLYCPMAVTGPQLRMCVLVC